ncbi:MAG: DNA methyltransferase, partial [Nitrososphaera sp.]
MDMELHALEGYCETCGRFFKRIDTDDLRCWAQAQAEFERRKENLLFPRQAIPTEGRSDPRPVNHGYTHFWQMFNERQLLCLSILLEQILKIADENVRELMLAAFSDCLDSNNMFCKYEIEWHKVSLFFGLHAYHPIERPAENNVWGTAFGRGTFVKCFEKVRRGKVYCKNPYERLFDLRGRRYSKRTGDERIEGSLVQDFDALGRTERAALLRAQSSDDLSFIPDKSVDAVITDPPYFDNVQYSELADFFYVWLRLALKDRYPWFEPELSNRANEIVKNDKLGKTMGFFNQGLRRVFVECHRILKDDGLLVFTFHHNKTWAWEGIAQLLL